MDWHTRQKAFKAIREMGGDRVVVSYEGGNDEGHVDAMYLYDGKKQIRKLEDPPTMVLLRDENGAPVRAEVKAWDDRMVMQPQYRKRTDEEEKHAALAEILQRPVYDAYGSFAGEFFVAGDVVWDAVREKVMLDGEEMYKRRDMMGRWF